MISSDELKSQTSSGAMVNRTRDPSAGTNVGIEMIESKDKTKYVNHILASDGVKMSTMRSNGMGGTRAKSDSIEYAEEDKREREILYFGAGCLSFALTLPVGQPPRFNYWTASPLY